MRYFRTTQMRYDTNPRSRSEHIACLHISYNLLYIANPQGFISLWQCHINSDLSENPLRLLQRDFIVNIVEINNLCTSFCPNTFYYFLISM